MLKTTKKLDMYWNLSSIANNLVERKKSFSITDNKSNVRKIFQHLLLGWSFSGARTMINSEVEIVGKLLFIFLLFFTVIKVLKLYFVFYHIFNEKYLFFNSLYF